MGMAVAIIEACKLVMQGLPNIEVTSFFVMLFTLVLGKKMLLVVPAFTLIEGCIYGFGIWWVMYLYAWPLLAFITWLVRKKDSVLLYSIISGVFGLFFGALCSIPYLFIGGPAMMFNWWIAGIPFDLIHGPSNFLIMLLLYKPVRRVMDSIVSKNK
ncbi:MAG: hypothetical protein E7488_03095 [Ruminococcaceae bacterium]|nr:hypothetical protein [Oscillospiraceae bacterium]